MDKLRTADIAQLDGGRARPGAWGSNVLELDTDLDGRRTVGVEDMAGDDGATIEGDVEGLGALSAHFQASLSSDDLLEERGYCMVGRVESDLVKRRKIAVQVRYHDVLARNDVLEKISTV